jgi:hypothetical protein
MVQHLRRGGPRFVLEAVAEGMRRQSGIELVHDRRKGLVEGTSVSTTSAGASP